MKIINHAVVAVSTMVLFSCGIRESEEQLEVQDSSPPSQKLTSSINFSLDTTFGIQVSQVNGSINWESVKNENVQFAYAQASSGVEFTDAEFLKNWNEMKKHNIKRGAIHEFDPSECPVEQAKLFVATISTYEKNDLPPVLSLEGSNIGGLSRSEYQNKVKSWLSSVEKEIGIKPIIYTDCSFGESNLKDDIFSKYALWVADKLKDNPEMKEAESWRSQDYVMQKHSTLRSLPGVEGRVDASYLLALE